MRITTITCPQVPSRRELMAKNVILWLLGVPISVLILLNLFGVL